ncbi:MAG: DUF58 domain-containing protein [Betaproteobacteria bacterium]|nr:DUF58 domain-containing protein [Betaproteobacteria bacterium]
MWTLSYRLNRAASGLQYWVTRRFSRPGQFALGMLVIAAALGADTNQTLAYQVFCFLVALITVAMLAASLTRTSIAIERQLPPLISAGQPFSYTVRVHNRGGAIDGVSLLERPADPRPTFAEFRRALRFPSYRGYWRLTRARIVADIDETLLPALLPNSVAEVRVNGIAWRRGVLHLDAPLLALADPTGLVRSLARAGEPGNTVVLPRRYPMPPFAFPGSRKYQQGGVSLASSVGESEEFMSLREYRPGDPLAHVHWKSFARVGKPVVMEFQDEFFERHALVLDNFDSTPEERITGKNKSQERALALAFEEAVAIAASFAYTIDTHECLLDLLFAGTETFCYTAGRGQLQPAALLEVLAGVQMCRSESADASPADPSLPTRQPLESLHHAVMQRRAALSGCVLVLIDWDEARRELVRRLRESGLALLVLLVSAEPVESPPAWLHVLTPGKIEEGLARLQGASPGVTTS